MAMRVGTRLHQFKEDSFGGITALTITVFIIMMASVGMAVDFMRHETYRAELQDAMDRGVLAAASFSQSIDADKTVREYLKSTHYVKHCYKITKPIVPVITTGSRTIEATATCELDTYFLKLVGIPKLNVLATGKAIEGASQVEVSLVLDISTSMVIFNANGTSNTRLEELQSAASTFVDSMFDGVNEDRMTMSLIPFAGQVNVGKTAFNYLRKNKVHNKSRCIEFEKSDFVFYDNTGLPAHSDGRTYAHPSATTMLLPPYRSRNQMQHFNFSKYWSDVASQYQHGPVGVQNVNWGWCPKNNQDIEYFSDDKEALKKRIKKLKTHEATGTHYGMKWAATLLDPNTSGLTAELIRKGDVSSTQSQVPRDYDDPEVQKYVVLMSDGATTGQVRLDGNLYKSDADYDKWATQLSDDQENDFIDVDLDAAQIFQGDEVDGGYTFDPQVAAREASRQAFLDICETAKDNNVIIFTIGFDLDTNNPSATTEEYEEALRAQSDLAACASTPTGHFFDVSGDGLTGAFAKIASTIQKLKLLN